MLASKDDRATHTLLHGTRVKLGSSLPVSLGLLLTYPLFDPSNEFLCQASGELLSVEYLHFTAYISYCSRCRAIFPQLIHHSEWFAVEGGFGSAYFSLSSAGRATKSKAQPHVGAWKVSLLRRTCALLLSELPKQSQWERFVHHHVW